MGVYIKGMEMPKNCWQCPMVGGYELSDEVKARYSTLHCRLLKCKTPAGVRPEDCPLVPIPPHGRLIDADALFVPYDICDGKEAMEFIKAAPIIIPAYGKDIKVHTREEEV